MSKWQIQEAKAHLSEVIERAQSEGPQEITKHGKARAFVVSVETYEVLREGTKAQPDFKHFLLHEGPKFDEFEIERDKDTGREIDLE